MADENDQGGGYSEGGDGGGGEGGGSPEPLTSAATPENQARAKEMGWIPPADWRGAPENFTDADEFLKRGETLVPFLRADRRRLTEQVTNLENSNRQLQNELRQTRESVQELATFSQEMAKERNARRKGELNELIRQAVAGGNETQAAELRGELNDIVTRERAAEDAGRRRGDPSGGDGNSRTDSRGTPERPTIQPWVKSWLETPENTDFLKVPHQADVFNGVMARMRQGGDKRVGDTDGTAFLNDAMKEAKKVFGQVPNLRREEDGRVAESRASTQGGGGSPRGGNGQTWNSLPKEARDKCDAMEKKFVGQGKLFKDQAAWRRNFVSEYYGPSAAVAERMLTRHQGG